MQAKSYVDSETSPTILVNRRTFFDTALHEFHSVQFLQAGSAGSQCNDFLTQPCPNIRAPREDKPEIGEKTAGRVSCSNEKMEYIFSELGSILRRVSQFIDQEITLLDTSKTMRVAVPLSSECLLDKIVYEFEDVSPVAIQRDAWCQAGTFSEAKPITYGALKSTESFRELRTG